MESEAASHCCTSLWMPSTRNSQVCCWNYCTAVAFASLSNPSLEATDTGLQASWHYQQCKVLLRDLHGRIKRKQAHQLCHHSHGACAVHLKVLGHPPCSQDLLLDDFHVFHRFKKAWKGHRLGLDDEDGAVFWQHPRELFGEGILVCQWHLLQCQGTVF